MDKHALQQTVEHLEARRVGGDHPGWQLFVSLGGDVIADLVGGEARAGQEMAPDTILMWFSSTKIVPAIATAQLWEKGAFALDDAVAEDGPTLPQIGDRVRLVGCTANGDALVTVVR